MLLDATVEARRGELWLIVQRQSDRGPREFMEARLGPDGALQLIGELVVAIHAAREFQAQQEAGA